MLITGIHATHRRAGRFDLIVDEKSFAIVSLEVIDRLELRIGTSIVGLEERINAEAARLALHDRALNMLAFRARSSTELSRALVRKGEKRAEVELVVSRLQEQGLLDDARFAESYTRSKVLNARESRRRVEQGLARKGVSRQVSDAAISRVFEEEGVDQSRLAVEAARKKMRSLVKVEAKVQKRRLYAFLVRRGFGPDEIRAALIVLREG